MRAATLVLAGLLAAGAAAPARVAGQPAEARRESDLPLRGPVLSQRPLPALPPGAVRLLAEATSERALRRLPQAAALLAQVEAVAPHHPALVTEAVRLRLEQGDLDGALRLGRGERTAQHDSLLVAPELVYAAERLARPAEAVDVLLEAWGASPRVAEWGERALLRLAAGDPRGVRERMRRLARARPGRGDLVVAGALLEARAGDPRGAVAALAAADGPGVDVPLRLSFAQRLVYAREAWEPGAPGDTAAAVAALTSLAGDARFPAARRLLAAQFAAVVQEASGWDPAAAAAMATSLGDVPAGDWPPGLRAALARALGLAGRTAEARALLRADGAAGEPSPELRLAAALADLRDGPPARAVPDLERLARDGVVEAAWYQAEALFFAGESDSARPRYEAIAAQPLGPFRGAALERLYLLEAAEPRAALPVFGRLAYEQWRGERAPALLLSDSLVRALPRGPLWARAALLLSGLRAAAGDDAGALAPLLAVADSLPDDRLAPLARQRAGDLYLERLRDPGAALAQYEECLARYPRAWNAPEVRRAVERLRREARP